MTSQRIILVCCGSFNPPTIMHLRMFELARDFLHRMGQYNVIGGVISPVHDAYGKQGLLPAQHRLEMCKLSVENNSWIKISSWEANLNNIWTKTRKVMDYHQNAINEYIQGQNRSPKQEWMPELDNFDSPVLLKLLCGADVLESFNKPGLWEPSDMFTIARDYGIVTITRNGNNPYKSIHLSDALFENEKNITVVQEWIANEISSTEIRLAIKRQQSIRYLVTDSCIDYIETHQLYSPLSS